MEGGKKQNKWAKMANRTFIYILSEDQDIHRKVKVIERLPFTHNHQENNNSS